MAPLSEETTLKERIRYSYDLTKEASRIWVSFEFLENNTLYDDIRRIVTHHFLPTQRDRYHFHGN